MRFKYFYLAAFVVFLTVLALRTGQSYQVEGVEAGELPGSYGREWYELQASEANGRGIRLVVDGALKDSESRARMTEEGDFLIPVEDLTSLFSCAVHIYENTTLVMEKNTVRAELTMGEKRLSVNGEAFPIGAAITTENGILMAPSEAVEKAFAYETDWDPRTNTLSFTETRPELNSLPAAYDYRQVGRAPAVKNQGSLGTCWAFASLMALESRLLPEEDLDFSEDHMSIRNSFHMDQNDGGEYTMSMAYLLAWQGPVLEEDDIYGDGVSPKGLSPVRHVQEIQILPEKDYEAIKEAVFFTGGVQSSLYTSMAEGEESLEYYNKEKGAYHYNGRLRPNHDVVIIGWDDHYPKENFPTEPQADGAFICANSWGGAFGEEGYFYVSYYDTNIGIHNILYSRVDRTDRYSGIYQTDLCGWAGQLGYGKEEAFFANIYEAEREEALCAVGFYATGEDTEYQVYVARDVSGSSDFGSRQPAAEGSLQYSGYYTIDFDQEIPLKEGEKFAVIVSVRTPGSVHPVAIEYASPERGGQVDISDGEGYISLKGTVWDRVEEEQDCNVCLKAYTR